MTEWQRIIRVVERITDGCKRGLKRVVSEQHRWMYNIHSFIHSFIHTEHL